MFQDTGFVKLTKRSSGPVVSSRIVYKPLVIEKLTWDDVLNLPISDRFTHDIECYPNLFYIAFKHSSSGRIYDFEMSPDSDIDYDKLQKFLWRFLIIGFNSNGYDMLMIEYCLKILNDGSRPTTMMLKIASDDIIQNNLRGFQFREIYKTEKIEINTFDIMEVCPVTGSLKKYAARLMCSRMQDLPISPEIILTKEQAELIKNYCGNDLSNTELLVNNLSAQIELRKVMGKRYRSDLRSKSDAQIAETVIGKGVMSITGTWPKRPQLSENYSCRYDVPDGLGFRTEALCRLLADIEQADFYMDAGGSPRLPDILKDGSGRKKDENSGRKIKIGQTTYQFGMGGLHSCESTVAHIAGEDEEISDNDVESYYPRLILNQNLEPDHLKGLFLPIYSDIVEERIEAKRTKNTTTADSLKIVINGSFGKLGSKYSILYAPKLMLQVTISGQLYLLMLIEGLEMAGISVISANTDGIVLKYKKDKRDLVRKIIESWENHTKLKTEETQYKALYSRDVNSYIAVKMDGSTKNKGAYSNPWSDSKQAIFRFHKNPQNTICIEAVSDYLSKGTSIADTIMSCREIGKFLTVRDVKGGGEKDGIYLGKTVRWYQSNEVGGTINYCLSGNKVPKSDGGRPCMDLPDQFPSDIDYSWYKKECLSILKNLGAISNAKATDLLKQGQR